jgi:hypothetical protein
MAYGTSRIYKHDHPQLSIASAGGRNLGRCYNEHYYRIMSLSPLSGKRIRALREAGFLGYGQGFGFSQRKADGTKCAVPDDLDWRTQKDVEPTGHHEVPCSEVDDRTGEVIRVPSINPYSGQEDKPTQIAYYVYDCVDTIDSGD